MRAAIIDFETTSADKDTARPWGWAVSVTDGAFKNLLGSFHGLMWADDYEDISEAAMRVCRIRDSRLPITTPHTSMVIPRIIDILIGCEVVVAYNAEFDKSIFARECGRQEVALTSLDWLCALNDVVYEDYYRCRQLSHICFDHGIHVQGAHDAKADTEAVMRLLNHRGETVEKMRAYRDEPWVFMRAILPKPWGKDEKVAKQLQAAAKLEGYSWQTAKGTDTPVFEKMWVKRVKQGSMDAEKEKKLPFKREILKI